MSESRFLLEVCVDTADGLAAAIAGGADRIELCAALALGGLTPSPGLMRLATGCAVPVRAMVRPREGDFCYSPANLDQMRRDIDAAAACGLEGVVFGATLPDGEPDLAALRVLASHAHAQGLTVTLHRAFDLARDPLAALEAAIALGAVTVLTSGGARTAPDGVTGLAALVKASAGRIEILAGAGVTAANAARIAAAGITAFHASCGAPVPVQCPRASALGYVRDGIRDTDAALVRQLATTLAHLETAHVVC